MDESLEQVWQDLIADDESAEVLQPGIESFDLPAAFVAAQLAAVLCRRLLSILAMRADVSFAMMAS